MKVTLTPIVMAAHGTVTRDWYKDGELGNKRTRGHHPNNSIVAIGHNTKESPEDLRRLIVTQTPVEYHQLMLV